MAKKSFFKKTNPYPAEEISDSNHPQNKLQQKSQINLQNKKKKSHHKKISGFQLLISLSKQFAPGSSSKVLITSADS
nr:uncharacterized protein LOC112023946 isoform X2 [Quercus suber]